MSTYRPLPEFLEIRRSSIDGHGLFTTEAIREGTVLGITHVKDDRFPDGYIRTPLGGFFNHSDDGNCEAFIDGDYIKLKTIKDVLPGNELTAFYWLYDLSV
tara:strand:+ start:548 stop:850 length:303 start_codon:yes stop_codon:yes gene_type:complete